MQKCPRIGEIVHARRRRWRISDVREYETCALVTLDARHAVPSPSHAASAFSRAQALRLLVPFDELQLAREDALHPLRVDRSRWLRRLARLSANASDVDSLQTALTADFELFAYQLEPAIAMLRGRTRRLLIADDVGLGKTVQAGLAAAELLTRGLVDRVLVLAPAGLREQWVAELHARFTLDFALLDIRGIQTRRAQLPAHVNPWATESRVVTSIDYVKRPETRPAAAECRWDLVIVDEAHGSVTGERYQAVSELCSTAGAVILLTATPHSGDRAAFERLCAIGSAGDPLLFFRRTRADAGLPRERRVHQLNVRSTPAERKLHAVLDRFAAAVQREHAQRGEVALALSVLRKRAMSSASSLARTVRRRLDQLASPAAPLDDQLTLDFSDPAGEQDADQDPVWTCPPLRDAVRERQLLATIIEAATIAAVHESKVCALRRLLARVHEPVLVFTEYRDTLLHLRSTAAPDASLLHGGLSRAERAAAIEAFTHGQARVLLATDAAGEGLNLHHRCRVVVNVELPWNPVRLEQRTGRVDRIGQRRRVHTFHLVAHDAGERAVADRLDARRADAEKDLDDQAGARIDVSREIERLRAVRRQLAATRRSRDPWSADANRRAGDDAHAVAVCIGGRARWRAALGAAAIVVFRLELVDPAGRAIAARLVPLGIALADGTRIRTRAELRRFATKLTSLDLARHDARLKDWVAANVSLANTFCESWRTRELGILERLDVRRLAYRQQSLFTQRIDADEETDRRARTAAAAQLRLSTALHRRTVTPETAPVLILLP
jgi:superfamily II DNA or RNA helicase